MGTTPTPVLAESTAGIELPSGTERVTAPEVEALDPGGRRGLAYVRILPLK